jgi:hypothetical protein
MILLTPPEDSEDSRKIILDIAKPWQTDLTRLRLQPQESHKIILAYSVRLCYYLSRTRKLMETSVASRSKEITLWSSYTAYPSGQVTHSLFPMLAKPDAPPDTTPDTRFHSYFYKETVAYLDWRSCPSSSKARYLARIEFHVFCH